jgi:hypothetical protein
MRALEMQDKGHTHAEIAAAEGVARPTITKLLSRHNRKTFERLAREHASERGRQIRIINRTVREAMTAWEKSKRKGKSRKTTQDEAGAVVQVEKMTKGQCGDPRYLEAVRLGLAEIRRVMMMDRPEQSGDDVAAGSVAVTLALEKLSVMARKLNGDVEQPEPAAAGRYERDIGDDDDQDADADGQGGHGDQDQGGGQDRDQYRGQGQGQGGEPDRPNDQGFDPRRAWF